MLSNAVLHGMLVAGIALTVFGLAPAAAAPNTHLNAAGMVIKHGDGSVLYFYVQFSEPEVAATDLLQKAGVPIDVAPYAGIGQAVCRIGGEGCPSTNCFCKSYSSPSVYWRYERLSPNGTWISLPYAASKKSIHDGDVVGFSWSSEDGDLPAVSLDQIAQMNGISRAATSDSVQSSATAAQVSTPAASVTASQAPTATPAALGVEVQASGTVKPVDARTTNSGASATSYAWFGAGVGLLALLGVVVVARRRRGRP